MNDTRELLKLREAIRKVRETKGDDRCWKDWEAVFALLPEGYTSPATDSTIELENCKQFIACSQDPRTKYVSPQRRIEELEALNTRQEQRLDLLTKQVGDLSLELERMENSRNYWRTDYLRLAKVPLEAETALATLRKENEVAVATLNDLMGYFVPREPWSPAVTALLARAKAVVDA